MAFDNAHYLLQSALQKSPVESHPSAPYHGGGPSPKVDAHAYAEAALWLADKAQPLLDPRDVVEFKRWVDLAREQHKPVLSAKQARAKIEWVSSEEGPAGVLDMTKQQKELLSADASKASRIPLKVGIWAAHEVANCAFRPIYAGGAARPSAGNLAKHLAKVRPAELAGFLAELDRYCVHLDLLTRLRELKLAPTSPPVRTLWRGIQGDKVSHWLMDLKNGTSGLLTKVGARWAIVEGTREEVLANVPDGLFAAAAARS